jgi:O-methyltransferase involved in polyketide biosynthesis
MNSFNHDFTTISPSAKSLLLMKGHTNIPFALETAGLIELPARFKPDYQTKDVTFWARTLHFESRYWSIDQLLSDLPVRNILELSSGFSFRGLEMINKTDVHYIDTDLPDVIRLKNDFLSALLNGCSNTIGKLELMPLNALDEMNFKRVTGGFSEGEVVILNEGLLMYLNTSEKERLCSIIREILHERGGYWITADIYVKKKNEKIDLEFDGRTKEFFRQHNIEENKFLSFEEAGAFFSDNGFVIDKEATIDHSKCMSLRYLMKNASPHQMQKMKNTGRISTTWRLKLAKNKPLKSTLTPAN